MREAVGAWDERVYKQPRTGSSVQSGEVKQAI
jgi:hypothetical protein